MNKRENNMKRFLYLPVISSMVVVSLPIQDSSVDVGRGMDIICKRFIKGMEKANNMMTDNDMMCWHALYTEPTRTRKVR